MTDCIVWQGRKFPNGYGAGSRANGQDRYAHRAAYIKAFGPIPKGLSVLHRCDVRDCINPEHLFIGTAGDNIRDAVSKGRHVPCVMHGLMNPKSVFTAEQVRAIRQDKRSIREICAAYGVGRYAVTGVVKGLTYKDVL